jgi:hypothetical protein
LGVPKFTTAFGLNLPAIQRVRGQRYCVQTWGRADEIGLGSYANVLRFAPPCFRYATQPDLIGNQELGFATGEEAQRLKDQVGVALSAAP